MSSGAINAVDRAIAAEVGEGPLADALRLLARQGLDPASVPQNFVRSQSAEAAGGTIGPGPGAPGPVVTMVFNKATAGSKLLVQVAANVKATTGISVDFTLMVDGVQQGAAYNAQPDGNLNISIAMLGDASPAAGNRTIELIASPGNGSTVTVPVAGATLTVEEVLTLSNDTSLGSARRARASVSFITRPDPTPRRRAPWLRTEFAPKSA